MNINNIKIPGSFNIENYMAAIGLIKDEINNVILYNIANSFTGVKHRLNLVDVIKNRYFYESSIDSTPSRTLKTLSCFSDNVIIILGGRDKNLNYSVLINDLKKKTKKIIIYGESKDLIYNQLFDLKEKIILENNLEHALNLAFLISKENDKILLSPACTSFDQYNNYIERGEDFIRIVNKIKNIDNRMKK